MFTSNLSDSFFDNLIEQNHVIKLNLKNGTGGLEYKDYAFVEIDRSTFCIATSTTEAAGCYLNLHVYSDDGNLLCEIKERLASTQYKFGICRFKNGILISARFLEDQNEIRLYDKSLALIEFVKFEYNNPIVYSDNQIIYVTAKSTFCILDEFFAEIKMFYLSDHQFYLYFAHPTGQIVCKYDKTYSYHRSELRIVDNKNQNLLKVIKLDEKFKNFTYWPTSEDTFILVDHDNKYVHSFNLDLEVLTHFPIKNISEIGKFCVTDSARFGIIDPKEKTAYIF